MSITSKNILLLLKINMWRTVLVPVFSSLVVLKEYKVTALDMLN
jgi:hypothetical protein